VISPSEVIERLLRTPVRERNVLDARRVYSDLPSRECVWSGTALGNRFDVDHVLPFSLWRNNDLWNLLPANPQVNRDKGDSLPTNALLKRRRDVILSYWHALHGATQKRFEVVVEAVEVTALQRGCLRWEP
jgi:CRISPR/Cas system Type II protein with McrA/HNH and RuvC-like nuclease domain